MTTQSKPSPETIIQARADNPKLRERDLAYNLGISEADFVAAHCLAEHGAPIRARRIRADVKTLLENLASLGEIMTLTRNESAVHEKIGQVEKAIPGDHAALTLGPIDLRIFPKHWVFGFAVEKRDGDEIRRSLQYFDASGEAVHKVHLRPTSNVDAYDHLVDRLLLADQSATLATQAPAVPSAKADMTTIDRDAFRQRWSALTDVHEFIHLLRDFSIDRHQAVHLAGQDFAWRVAPSAVAEMMNQVVEKQVSIMCFVNNRGCIQIHTGPLLAIKMMGPWLNVLDPTFHLHLRNDHIADAWVVRKPTKDGHVTSLEAYDKHGELIIQFFGERHEGEAELQSWREIVEGLPQAERSNAA